MGINPKFGQAFTITVGFRKRSACQAEGCFSKRACKRKQESGSHLQDSTRTHLGGSQNFPWGMFGVRGWGGRVRCRCLQKVFQSYGVRRSAGALGCRLGFWGSASMKFWSLGGNLDESVEP